jgi:hypothetical protein
MPLLKSWGFPQLRKLPVSTIIIWQVNWTRILQTEKRLVATLARQGDQIGRIFAYWAFECFGQFFLLKIAEEAQTILQLFPTVVHVVY